MAELIDLGCADLSVYYLFWRVGKGRWSLRGRRLLLKVMIGGIFYRNMDVSVLLL